MHLETVKTPDETKTPNRQDNISFQPYQISYMTFFPDIPYASFDTLILIYCNKKENITP